MVAGQPFEPNKLSRTHNSTAETNSYGTGWNDLRIYEYGSGLCSSASFDSNESIYSPAFTSACSLSLSTSMYFSIDRSIFIYIYII